MQGYSFGVWLKRKRKALDLTQGELAGQLGCSAAAIRKIEAEERRPSAQIAARLAEIFNIPQTEQAAFLRFARGDWRSAPRESKEDVPWYTSTKSVHSNLPARTTSLIGREKEIVEVHEYLSRPDIRLVTLIGPPGIGKTSLSVESARTALSNFPEGVFFVSLAPLDGPALIAVTIAQALGYVGAQNISTNEQLKDGIGEKQMLIVLDNCEHLIEDVASLISPLLSACSRLKILATSRESLRIPGEWLYPVPLFDVPTDNSSVDVEISSDFPALTLFAERARAVRPDFVLNANNIKTISTICAKLDGLPLAIELIAARMRLMSPKALLARLNDQFILSADGMRAASERQKTLNDAIRWSYDLLSAEEQKLFAYLSVFSGGFTLDSAESIFSRSFTGKPVRDLITSLLDKSLLQYVADYEVRDESCYTMLVTIQDFAKECLRKTEEESEIRNGHLDYFLALAETANRELRGANQLEWLNRLHTVRDNLRVALDWAIETGQTEKALQLARNLWWFWSKRSEFNEGRQWLGRVLALHDAPLFSDLYADVLTQMAHHTCLQIGGKEASPFIQQALPIARAHGNPQTLASALMVFGIALTFEENFATAQSALEESMTLFRETHDEWGYTVALMSLGYSAYRKDDQATALMLRQQALTVFRELGDTYFQSVCLYAIGNLRAKQEDWERGLAELRESLRLSRGLGSKYESAAGLFRLAETEQELGKFARAVRLYCAARNVYDSIGAWHQEDNPKWEEHIASCHVELSESAFAEAMEEGRSMTMEQAIVYALENQE